MYADNPVYEYQKKIAALYAPKKARPSVPYQLVCRTTPISFGLKTRSRQ